MGYAATTGDIIDWNPDQPFVIQISYHVWFDEYNSSLSIEDNHTPGSLLIKQYPESILHHLDSINLISYELDLISTQFFYITMITNEIELPPAREIDFNLLDYEYFTIPEDIATIPNSPDIHQLLAQAKKICRS